jgi:hypothetical protein
MLAFVSHVFDATAAAASRVEAADSTAESWACSGSVAES